jgi:hypothetical protein
MDLRFESAAGESDVTVALVAARVTPNVDKIIESTRRAPLASCALTSCQK